MASSKIIQFNIYEIEFLLKYKWYHSILSQTIFRKYDARNDFNLKNLIINSLKKGKKIFEFSIIKNFFSKLSIN